MFYLFFSINAGCTALPALLNIKQVMQQRQVTGIWNGKDELPVSTSVTLTNYFIFMCFEYSVGFKHLFLFCFHKYYIKL